MIHKSFLLKPVTALKHINNALREEVDSSTVAKVRQLHS